ncbi:hypothetical protein AaE_003547 [Aphanomyces astaci]|uniref:Uncharacterized protein n=1 Tax=Aphanomyces astaci TaxID=112090 RepID=A0A6A5ATI0_APHAT|nr:hypothetical protein AaE_003547 [Aphanomyces astaci]
MSAFHFSAVNEIVSPVLRDDHDEMMWERQGMYCTSTVRMPSLASPLTPSFEFNNVAGRLRSRRNSSHLLRSTSYSGQTYGTSGESGDLDASKDITLFDGEYHSIYVSPAPKGWRGILVLLQSPILLVCIGIFAAFLGLWMDAMILRVTMFHQELASLGFFAFLIFSLAMGGVGTVLVHFVCPQAAGSGLPQMKVALSGKNFFMYCVDMREYLSPTCLMVKMAGLVTAYAAGTDV